MERRPPSTHAPASRARREPPHRRRWPIVALAVALLAAVLLASTLLRSSAPGAVSGAPEPGAWALLPGLRRLLGVGSPSGPPHESGDPRDGTSAEPSAPRGRRAPSSPVASGTRGAPGQAGSAASTSTASGPTGASSSGEPSAAPLADDTPRDARVAGRVLDATGGPIGGALVRAHFSGAAQGRARALGPLALSRAPSAEWTTDAEGRFEGLAPEGALALRASAEGYTEAYQGGRAPALDVVIVLAPGSRVSGRVQRSDGSPVSGASLEVRARALNRAPVQGTSDERGEFSIGGVPAGVVELTASAAGLSGAHEWLHLGLAEASAPVVLTLTAAHSVHGVVLQPDGAPCPAGLVRVEGQFQQMATIDAQGRYRIDGIDDGTHSLAATCHDLGTKTQSVTLGADSPPSLQLDWQLDAGFAVTGTVRRNGGEPVAGAPIWLYGVAAPDGAKPGKTDEFAGASGVSCSSDAAGEFTCDGLRAGWYRVNAGKGGARVVSEPVRVDAQSKPRVELVMPETAEVRVRVTGSAATIGDGVNPFSPRGVFARNEEPFPIPASPTGDGYVFEGLALGRYRIAIGRARSELGPSAVDVALTEPGQVIEVELRAPEPLGIAGSVVDAAGEPLPDAWVEVSLVEPEFMIPTPLSDPVLTSTDGSFQVSDVPPGRYAVRASHPSGEAELLDVAAGRGDVRLVVQGYGSLSGSVTTADGQPARDFSVVIVRASAAQPLGADGRAGGWALPWITPGDYQVVIMSPLGGASADARVISGKETRLDLRLDPELAGQAILSVLRRR